MLFHNPVATIAGFAGGPLFACTYDRTRSTFAVACEHSVYGWLMFTIVR